jgi:hypothetical protein
MSRYQGRQPAKREGWAKILNKMSQRAGVLKYSVGIGGARVRIGRNRRACGFLGLRDVRESVALWPATRLLCILATDRLILEQVVRE